MQITKNGRNHVVLLGAEDLEPIGATRELLSDLEAQKRLRVAESEVIAGDVLDEHALRELLAQRLSSDSPSGRPLHVMRNG